MSDSEMETEQDLYSDSMENKENNNTTNGTPMNSIARKESYMRLLNRIEEIRETENTGLHTAESVYQVLQEVKALDEECHIKDRLDKVDEFVMDAHILNSASEVVIKCFNALQLSVSNYDPTEFTNKLRESIEDPTHDELQDRDLLKLLKVSRKIVRQIPHYGALYGAYDPSVLPEPKQRKQRNPRRQDAREKLQKKTLENIAKVAKEELSVDEIVSHQRRVLEEEFVNNGRQPIDYYKFVIDTDSFPATVENMFYFSFLIQNGSAALNIVDRQPVIEPVSKRSKEKFKKDGEANVQMIASICEDEWKALQADVGVGFLQQHKIQIANNNTC